MARIALAVCTALAALAACGAGGDRPAGTVTVARIVDGDTLDLADGRTVRLVQIDTPELGSGERPSRHYARGGPARDPHGLDGDRDGVACELLP